MANDGPRHPLLSLLTRHALPECVVAPAVNVRAPSQCVNGVRVATAQRDAVNLRPFLDVGTPF